MYAQHMDVDVLTWNVKFKEATILRHLSALKLPLDVVALQEVKNDHVSGFKESLAKMGLVHFHHSGTKSTRKRYGNVIASRAPLTVVPVDEPAPFPQLIAQAVVNDALHVIAVHAPNGSKNGWDKIATLLAVRKLVERAKHPVVVMGDFNEPRYFEGVTPVRSFAWSKNWERDRDRKWTRSNVRGKKVTRPRHEWDDAVRWFFEKDLRHAYWLKCGAGSVAPSHLAQKTNARWFDHIFVSQPRIEVRDCTYHHELRTSRGASDHSGLTARLRVTR